MVLLAEQDEELVEAYYIRYFDTENIGKVMKDSHAVVDASSIPPGNCKRNKETIQSMAEIPPPLPERPRLPSVVKDNRIVTPKDAISNV